MSDPKRELDSFLDQVDQPLAETNVEAHAGMGPNILGDDRHHVTAPERRRQTDLQRTRRLLRYRVRARTGGLEVAENFARQLINAVRLGRRAELARGPEEK